MDASRKSVEGKRYNLDSEQLQSASVSLAAMCF